MGQLGDPYATLQEFKNYQGVAAVNQSNTSKDAAITQALDAASRQIEQFCGRQFNKQSFATPREFEVTNARSLSVDDFWTTDLLDIEFTSNPDVIQGEHFSDYYAPFPRNGIVDGSPGWPYYGIDFMSVRRVFLRGQYLTVTAKWGWPSVPATVKQATLIVANQLLRLADAPLGVTGMEGQFGGMIRVRDIPQVASMLNRFVSMPIMVG